MTVTHPYSGARRSTLVLLFLGVAAALVVGLQSNARAVEQVVLLSGTLDADDFVVAVDTADPTRLLLCAEVCFTRSRAEIGTIVVDGFDGDDTLTLHHNGGLATNAAGNLTISFKGGAGADDLEVCTAPASQLPACRSGVATSVTPGASVDERILTQTAGAAFVAVTLNDVGSIDDRVAGPVTVDGTETANQIAYRPVAGVLGRGEVAVDTLAPYRFAAKTQLVLDSAAGDDSVEVAGREGLTGTSSCGGSAPICVNAGAGRDTLSTAGSATDPEQVAVAVDGPGGADVTGLAGTTPLDLTGIDRVALALQSATDSLTLTTTADADVVRSSTTPAGLLMTGDLATDGSPFPLPEIALNGDGSGPLDIRLNAGAGDDGFEAGASAANDDVTVGPTDTDAANQLPDTRCTALLTTCLEIASEGGADHRITLADVQSQIVEAGAGDDTLGAVASLGSPTTWRGGEGTDRVDVRGTGPALSVALGLGSVTQNGAAPVTATATEVMAVHAAGGSVRTTGTTADDDLTFRPTGPAAGTLSRGGHPMRLDLVGVGGSNVLDPGAGDDTAMVEGSTGADRFAVGRGSDLAVQVDALLPLRVTGSEEAVLQGRGSDDRFDVTGDQGPTTLTVDGGVDAGGDTVTFAAATTDAEVSVDDDLGTGQVSVGGPAVGLLGIERAHVEGDGAHALVVRGSDAADTLSQTGNRVSVGRTTDVVFSGFPRLTVDSGPAADRLTLAPATTSGVTQLHAIGGGETDALTVLGTALSEQISYTPTGMHAGAVALTGAAPVSFAGMEETGVDGATAPPSGDVLTVRTPDHDGTLSLDPGAAFDAGTVRFRDVNGASTTAAPLHFGNLGRGEIQFAGDPAAPADRVVLTGQPDDDVVTLTTRSTVAGAEAVVALDMQLPVAVPGAHTLELDGRDGTDTFRIPTNHPIPGVSGPGIEVRGGGPSAGDRVVLGGGGGDLLVDLAGSTVGETGHAAVHQTGVERIEVEAAGAPLQVAGGSGPDAVTWKPTGPAAGELTAPDSPVVVLDSLGLLTLDTRGGADQVTASLRATADDVTLTRGPTSQVGVVGLQPLLLPATSVESLTVATHDGPDQVRVVGSGGPASLAVDGGAPSTGGDLLRLEAESAGVTYATDPTSGEIGSSGGAVGFTAVETIDVLGTGAGALTVNGTGGAETLTIGEEPIPLIGVDESAAVTYQGYPEVTLDGRAGNDDLTVGYGALGDITTLRMTGGAGTADQVTVADTTGTTRTLAVRPETATGGVVTATGIATAVQVAETELVGVNGRGGDDTVQVVTPTGGQQVVLDRGAVSDAAHVRVGSLLPLDLSQVGAAGQLSVVDVDGVRTDELVVRGTTAADAYAVDGDTGVIRPAEWLRIVPDGALDLRLLGGDGDDDVQLSGPLPFRTTTFDGGSPDLGDGLSVQGPSGPVEVNLTDATIVGYGGVVRFPGVVDVHTDLGGQALTQVGTPRDDALCYDPMAPRDGRLYIVGAPGGGTATSVCLPDQRGTNVLHTFVDVSNLTVDPGAGSDEVIVNGTTSRDLVSIHAHAPLTDVAVHPEPGSGSTFRLPVHVAVASTESLVVAADNGSDTVDVSAYDSSAPLISVFGEGPSTMRTADNLVLRDATGAAQLRDTNSHTKGAGTVTATYPKGSGAIIRVDYDGMELVDLVRDSKVD